MERRIREGEKREGGGEGEEREMREGDGEERGRRAKRGWSRVKSEERRIESGAPPPLTDRSICRGRLITYTDT